MNVVCERNIAAKDNSKEFWVVSLEECSCLSLKRKRLGEEQVVGKYQVIFGHVELKMCICFPSGDILWVAVNSGLHKRNMN